jgi:hypothetical protein
VIPAGRGVKQGQKPCSRRSFGNIKRKGSTSVTGPFFWDGMVDKRSLQNYNFDILTDLTLENKESSAYFIKNTIRMRFP